MLPSAVAPAAYAIYTPVRSVEPPDSPLPGVLALDPDGASVLLVDRELVADWPGWGAAEEPHILTPLDLVRRADGHDIVLPALTERVAEFCERRRDAEAPLSAGEAVTLAVSVVRGLSPSLMRAGDIEGEWWLTDDGRPMLAEGVGELTSREASARLLATTADAMPRTRLGAALHDLADAARHPRFAHESAGWEERLFACAEPEPLTTEVFGPRRARRMAAPTAVTADPPPRSLWQRVAFHADADLSAAASDAITTTLRRLRRASPRPRPAMIAAVLAAAIVVGGLLWPRGQEDAVPTSATIGSTPVYTASDPTPSGASAAPSEGVASGDPAAITSALLDQRNGCRDTACLASVLEDPAHILPAGVVDEPGEERQTVLLDDLGGLVVVRVDSLAGLPVQLATVVETEEGWRIRDVHDVTDAPS